MARSADIVYENSPPVIGPLPPLPGPGTSTTVHPPSSTPGDGPGTATTGTPSSPPWDGGVLPVSGTDWLGLVVLLAALAAAALGLALRVKSNRPGDS